MDSSQVIAISSSDEHNSSPEDDNDEKNDIPNLEIINNLTIIFNEIFIDKLWLKIKIFPYNLMKKLADEVKLCMKENHSITTKRLFWKNLFNLFENIKLPEYDVSY